MRQSTLMAAVKQFLKTTTLHGFKYLSSPYSIDRVGWLACCCASACCAGVLCAVLWARFQQVPALLVLRDLREGGTIQTMPSVAVCPPGDRLADLVMNSLTTKHTNETANLRSILRHVISSKPVLLEQLLLLERFMNNKSASLPEVLLAVSPPCEDLVRWCRWERRMVPCVDLFQYEMTMWGVCCLMKPKQRLSTKSLKWDPEVQISKDMDLIIECNTVNSTGCEFFTMYIGQETVEVVTLLPGFQYTAQVMFTAEVDADRGIEGERCDSTPEYSLNSCNMECIERSCGCTDPLLKMSYRGRDDLPYCSISNLMCVRASLVNRTCKCLPRCKKVFDASSLEASPIKGIEYSIDPLSADINLNTSIALYIRVRNGESRFYNSIATETWITLLASLGGVFNMFLGVGLFSALEVLYLVFVRIPIAISRPTDLHITPVVLNE